MESGSWTEADGDGDVFDFHARVRLRYLWNIRRRSFRISHRMPGGAWAAEGGVAAEATGIPDNSIGEQRQSAMYLEIRRICSRG